MSEPTKYQTAEGYTDSVIRQHIQSHGKLPPKITVPRDVYADLFLVGRLRDNGGGLICEPPIYTYRGIPIEAKK